MGFFYLDLHAHVKTKGCFLYGRRPMDVRDQWLAAFPLLCQMNSPYFEVTSCNFEDDKSLDQRGESREDSGRGAVGRDCGLHHAYTMECHFHSGLRTQPTPCAANLPKEYTNPAGNIQGVESVPYDCRCFAQVGEGVMVALLDLHGHNCHSRLSQSEHKNLEELLLSMRASDGDDSKKHR